MTPFLLSNISGLDVNYTKVADAIFTLTDQLRHGTLKDDFLIYQGQHFAATRVDVAAHSMGGLLVKWYVADFAAGNRAGSYARENSTTPIVTTRDGTYDYRQANDYDAGTIRRFVSLDTPFDGWPIANQVAPSALGVQGSAKWNRATGKLGKTNLTYDFVYDRTTGKLKDREALDDLSVNSNAYTLLFAAKYPTGAAAVSWHPLAGVAGTDLDLSSLPEKAIWLFVKTFLKDQLNLELSTLIQKGADSDYVVPVNSQLHYDPGTDEYKTAVFRTDNGSLFNNTAHVTVAGKDGITASLAAIHRVIELLMDDPSDQPDAGPPSFIPLGK